MLSRFAWTRSVTSGTLRLHAKSHFVLGDARFDFRVEFLFELKFVQRVQFVQHRPPAGAAGTVRIGHDTGRALCRGETGSPGNA